MDEMAKLQIRIDAQTARFDQKIKRTAQVFDRQARSIETRAAQLNTRMSRSSRHAFGNVSNQLQDVIVQAQMGTNAFRILAQQGPQIAGAFGPAGAAIGVLIAGLGLAGPAILGMTEKTKSAEEALDGLRATMGLLTEVQETFKLSLEDLRRMYGENIEAAARFRLTLAETALGAAQQDIKDLERSLRTLFQSMAGTPPRFFEEMGADANLLRAETEKYNAQIAKMAETLGIGRDEAISLNEIMVRLAQTKDFERQKEIVSEILDVLREMGVSLEDMPEDIQKALQKFADAELKIMEAKTASDALRDAIDLGADAAGRLASNAAEARDRIREAVNASFGFNGGVGGGRGLGPQGPLAGSPDAQLLGQGIKFFTPRKTSGGGGHGQGGGRARQDTTGERLVESIQKRIQKLREENQMIGLSAEARARLTVQFEKERMMRDLLAAAAKNGTTLTKAEVEAAKELIDAVESQTLANIAKEESLERMKRASEAAAERQRELAASVAEVSDRLLSAIQEANNFGEALKRIGFEALKLGINGLAGNGPLGKLLGGVIPGLFGGGGGGGNWFFNAKGNAFSSGRIVPFAQGGIVNGPVAFPMNGATGLMGEAGPEAILPLRRGRGGRLGVEMSGAGGGVTVIVNAHYDPGVNAATQSMIRQETLALEARMNRTLPGVVSAANRARPALR